MTFPSETAPPKLSYPVTTRCNCNVQPSTICAAFRALPGHGCEKRQASLAGRLSGDALAGGLKLSRLRKGCASDIGQRRRCLYGTVRMPEGGLVAMRLEVERLVVVGDVLLWGHDVMSKSNGHGVRAV